MPNRDQIPSGAPAPSRGQRGEGRAALVNAARLEFNEVGYDATNTNAIARRAGYAPQTFYRHFEDKLAIFLAVYRAWVVEEEVGLKSLTAPEAMADLVIDHHQRHRIFRRALRRLTVESERVGAARAEARRAQMASIAARSPAYARLGAADQLAGLLRLERLCDAMVDGEFERLGIPDVAARQTIVQAISDTLYGQTAPLRAK